MPPSEHGTIRSVPVLLLIAALAILGGVVLAALGRAGEMAAFAGDAPPLDLGEVTATDIVLLRPPMSLWGYNAQATEEALRVIARSVTERDVQIVALRRDVAELRAGGERPAIVPGLRDGADRPASAPGQRDSADRTAAAPAEPAARAEPAASAAPAARAEPGSGPATWPRLRGPGPGG